MSKYVLRWQYGLFNNEVKIHYTYGHIDTLSDKILVITIDKVEEVIKDIRNEKLIEYANCYECPDGIKDILL